VSANALDEARGRVIAALDVATLREAVALARPLIGKVGWVKIGKQLFVAEGPESVRQLRALGFRIFLDLKFHDIPNTVASAGVEAMRLGVDLFNVHASGGRRMMEETVSRVRAAAASAGTEPPKMIAVTVLTSLEQSDLLEIGYAGEPIDWVRRWSRLARESGLDGVVCSPREVAALREDHGPAFWLVTPGIRPAGSPPDDQRRTLTPGEAVRAGASLLVIGRPLCQAADPTSAADVIAADVAAALAPQN
jgi:orotidine-5'-phosphate decarboxylase